MRVGCRHGGRADIRAVEFWMSVALFLALGWRCSIVYVHYNWQRCPDGSVLERPCLHCVRRVHGRVHGRVVSCAAWLCGITRACRELTASAATQSGSRTSIDLEMLRCWPTVCTSADEEHLLAQVRASDEPRNVVMCRCSHRVCADSSTRACHARHLAHAPHRRRYRVPSVPPESRVLLLALSPCSDVASRGSGGAVEAVLQFAVLRVLGVL